jgi:hypothetical protein
MSLTPEETVRLTVALHLYHKSDGSVRAMEPVRKLVEELIETSGYPTEAELEESRPRRSEA